jgi:hypothetical protein
MTDNGEDDEEHFDTPTKLPTTTNFLETIKREREYGVAKKRKIGPKTEDFAEDEEEVAFGAREEDAEGNGDAIDFSLHYPAAAAAAAAVKMEEGGDVVDLTDEVGGDAADKEKSKDGKGKEKTNNGKGMEKVQMGGCESVFNNKVKKEVIDLRDMEEDEDDEMVV